MFGQRAYEGVPAGIGDGVDLAAGARVRRLCRPGLKPATCIRAVGLGGPRVVGVHAQIIQTLVLRDRLLLTEHDVTAVAVNVFDVGILAHVGKRHAAQRQGIGAGIPRVEVAILRASDHHAAAIVGRRAVVAFVTGVEVSAIEPGRDIHADRQRQQRGRKAGDFHLQGQGKGGLDRGAGNVDGVSDIDQFTLFADEHFPGNVERERRATTGSLCGGFVGRRAVYAQ